MRAVGVAALASLAAICGVGSSARAETLGKEACDAADAERAQLIAAGVPETVKKGPAWTKANLGRDKLKEVERYIALQEQLLFKCGQAKLRVLPPAEGDEGAEAAATEGAAVSPAPAPSPAPPKHKSTPKKAPAKAEAAATGDQTSEAAKAAKPAPKPRPKPKPKPDDAFKPPAATEPVKP